MTPRLGNYVTVDSVDVAARDCRAGVRVGASDSGGFYGSGLAARPHIGLFSGLAARPHIGLYLVEPVAVVTASATLEPAATARTASRQPTSRGYRRQPRTARGGRSAIAGQLAVRDGGGGVLGAGYRLGRCRGDRAPAGVTGLG